jgi:hypothetical protein
LATKYPPVEPDLEQFPDQHTHVVYITMMAAKPVLGMPLMELSLFGLCKAASSIASFWLALFFIKKTKIHVE